MQSFLPTLTLNEVDGNKEKIIFVKKPQNLLCALLSDALNFRLTHIPQQSLTLTDGTKLQNVEGRD